MQYVIDVDLNKCIACGACAVACMDQNDIDLEGGDIPFRKCTTIESVPGEKARITYLSLSCMHCRDPRCVRACPVGCIRKDEETGFVLYDNARCIGCHSCSMACPFSAPTYTAGGKMRKCDGCVTRVKNGMLPACVRVCPMNAMTLCTEQEMRERRQARAARSLADAAETAGETIKGF